MLFSATLQPHHKQKTHKKTKFTIWKYIQGQYIRKKHMKIYSSPSTAPPSIQESPPQYENQIMAWVYVRSIMRIYSVKRNGLQY